MADEETPSSAMYALLKRLKVSNKDAATVLLSDDVNFGGQPPRARISERTYLFRVVHAKPGEYPEAFFSPLVAAAQQLCSRLVGRGTPFEDFARLAALLTEEDADIMRAACDAWGCDGALFSNLVDKIAALSSISDADRASALLLAYVATGCYGDPSKAAELVEDFVASAAVSSFATELPSEVQIAPLATTVPSGLGLVRVVDGVLDMRGIHMLSDDPEGTVIGSLSTDVSALNDVGPLVSRRHLRVFRDADGRWFAQGLRSTNGTTLIRGDDKSEVVVEPPKSERSGPSDPVLLEPGDALCLAGTTVFLVMQMR